MATYSVNVNSDGGIIAGVTSKTGKFTNSSVVTNEALAAVRDHLLMVTMKEQYLSSKSMKIISNYSKDICL